MKCRLEGYLRFSDDGVSIAGSESEVIGMEEGRKHVFVKLIGGFSELYYV